MSVEPVFPTSPGVYLHKNSRGEIIYVGKAKNLKKRVTWYFTHKDHDPKTHLLVSNIVTTDFIVTNSELEALLLENRLIKKHKPKYNILLKESARYSYVAVTREKFPRIFATRKTNKRDRFFGPYTSSMGEIAKIMRELFKLRSCGPVMPKRTCIYYDLNLCTAPCENKVSAHDYGKQVEEAQEFIKTGNPALKARYAEEMKQASENKNYEKALELRKRVELFDRLEQRQIVDVAVRHDQDAVGVATMGERASVSVLKIKRGVILHKDDFVFLRSDAILDEFLKAYYAINASPAEILVQGTFDESIAPYLAQLWSHAVTITSASRGAKKELVELAQKNAYTAFNLEDTTLISMKDALRLDTVPTTIDCFDISNIGESVIVGACVQFKDKKPHKTAWRLYNIKGDFGQDDFRSMHEVIKRRYAAYPVPDLILIDGGIIQVDFAIRALSELGLECSVVGLAKKEETIIFPEGDSFVLPRNLAYAKLLIRIRNEVHRFAISHSRRRYKNTYKHSELDDIVGIGPATKFSLLRAFGSLHAVKEASREQLEEKVGKSKAKVVYEHFHSSEK